MTESLLSIRDLRAHFTTDAGVVRAVDGVCLDVAPGEILGLVGESGSGKSTLALSILRLLPEPPGSYPSGEIWFDGQDILQMTASRLREVRGRRISMIFQDPMSSLNPFLTVERHLTEVIQRHEGRSGSAARDRAVELLGRVGIADPATRVDQYPHELSGGMQQRVMIAMALLCEPALLLADEPTTALDATIQAQILTLIKDLVRDTNTAVILVTHDLQVVAGMADRVAVMYAGRVVEQGPTVALLESPAHPYTRGLLASAPSLASTPKTDLPSIPGSPPDLSQTSAGCPFAPRCDDVRPDCEARYPETVELGAGRLVNCWAAEERS